MMTKVFKLLPLGLLASLLICSFSTACSQEEEAESSVELIQPTWTPIVGNQFNMIATGKVFRNGVQLSESSYWVASYGPGGIVADCRSLSQVSSSGVYYATIRGNKNGDAIRFVIWDGKAGKAIDAAEGLTFKSDDTKLDFPLNFSE